MSLFIIIAVILLFSILLYFYKVEKNKYEKPIFKENLIHIDSFFEVVKNFDDYVTWVHRDEIKKQFSAVSSYFKYKTTFYKKEEKVKRFNEIYQGFNVYITNYNKM